MYRMQILGTVGIMAGIALAVLAAGRSVAAAPDDARDVVARMEAAWNAHDARRYAGQFTDDGDLVTAGGVISHGRSAITDRMREAFLTRAFSDSRRHAADVADHSLGPDAMWVRVIWSVDGVRTVDGAPAAGHRILETQILSRVEGKWRIAALQATVAADDRGAAGAAEQLNGRGTLAPAPPVAETRRCIVARTNGDCIIYGRRR